MQRCLNTPLITMADEQTPLLGRGEKAWLRAGVETRILVAGFLITLAFSYTQVP